MLDSNNRKIEMDEQVLVLDDSIGILEFGTVIELLHEQEAVVVVMDRDKKESHILSAWLVARSRKEDNPHQPPRVKNDRPVA